MTSARRAVDTVSKMAAVGLCLAAFVLGVMFGAAPRPKAQTAQSASTSVGEDSAPQLNPEVPSATVTVTESPFPAPIPTPGPGTIGEGTWSVGKNGDMAAGSWVAKAYGDEECYWARLKDDSGDVSAIVANSLSRGQARVRLRNGEFLETRGCTPWKKVAN